MQLLRRCFLFFGTIGLANSKAQRGEASFPEQAGRCVERSMTFRKWSGCTLQLVAHVICKETNNCKDNVVFLILYMYFMIAMYMYRQDKQEVSLNSQMLAIVPRTARGNGGELLSWDGSLSLSDPRADTPTFQMPRWCARGARGCAYTCTMYMMYVCVQLYNSCTVDIGYNGPFLIFHI
eukprot:scpid100992/ scgid15149/ 